MDYSKVTQAWTALFLCCLVFSLGSCGSKSDGDIVEVDKVVTDSLNKRMKAYAEATQEQRELLFRILKELDEVSDDAFALGRERQLNGQVKDVRLVDHIKYRLATIKTELNEAQKRMIDNPSLMATIDDLLEKINAQEDYIQNLRSSITIKKSDLKTRYIELDSIKIELEQNIQDVTLVAEELEKEDNKLNETMRSSWVSAGDKLVESADEVQLVKNSGPLVKRSREAKNRILMRAIHCYKEAEKMGYASANQKISLAESKIQY